MQVLGIDVGGSGIKGALVDLEQGVMATERFRIPTPESFDKDEIAAVIAEICNHFEYKGPVGVGFPAVVDPNTGIVKTPPTAHHFPDWVGHSVTDLVKEATGNPVVVVNDADAAGLAEAQYGVGQGVKGTVIVLTLGTGVGSGLFVDGKLVPNTEFGKIYLQGHKEVAEQYMASRIKEEQDLKWKEYGPRINEYLEYLEWLFTPNMFIIGGGISKKFEKMQPYFTVDAEVVSARLGNPAGIVGAATAAKMYLIDPA